jgi:hypothetical protein
MTDNNLRQRMESKTVRSASCWNWTGALTKDGYGTVTVDGRTQYAHRVAYEMERGQIPAGLVMDHLCRNRRCVNPDHLEPVTNRTNVLRGAAKLGGPALKTACKWGHPYDERNTGRRADDNRRYCLTCSREKARATYQKRPR